MNPYLILGIAAAWLASIVGVGYWQNSAGHTAEKAVWQARENAELAAANAKILGLEEAKRSEEQRRAQEVDAISTKFEKERTDAAAQRDRDVAAARAGKLVLRVPAACENSGGSEPSKATSGTGGRDAAKGAELPRAVTEGLYALADDADEIVRQLTACQAVVRSDRAPPP